MKASSGPQAEGRIDVGRYNPCDVTIIGIDTEDGPSHPLFDGSSNDSTPSEADVRFTMKHGVMQPVKCKRDGNRLVVVYGRGRTRQLRIANERLVASGGTPWKLPVEIVRGDEVKLLELKIGENHHRRTLDPMATARDALALSEKLPLEAVADTFGVSLSQIKNILKYNDFAPAVAKAVTRGKLSATAASQLTDLSAEEQEAKLTELLESGEKPTVERAAKKARESKGQEEKLTPKGKLMMISSAIYKLDESSTKEELWKVIGKIKKALEK